MATISCSIGRHLSGKNVHMTRTNSNNRSQRTLTTNVSMSDGSTVTWKLPVCVPYHTTTPQRHYKTRRKLCRRTHYTRRFANAILARRLSDITICAFSRLTRACAPLTRCAGAVRMSCLAFSNRISVVFTDTHTERQTDRESETQAPKLSS